MVTFGKYGAGAFGVNKSKVPNEVPRMQQELNPL